MSRTVGLVIPAYRPDIERLKAYIEALYQTIEPAVIRVELDAPERETVVALADTLATVNAVPERRGKGAAITAGFQALAAETDVDVFAFADADGSTPAESIRAVLEPVVSGRAGLAVGSRRHPDADVRSHQTFARRRLGDVFAWVGRRLLAVSLSDYQCGAKAIDRAAWTAVRSHLSEPGFAWDIELIALTDALGWEIIEVPVIWEDAPTSTVSPIGTSLELGVALLRARHRAKHHGGSRVHTAIARRRQPVALIDNLALEGGADIDMDVEAPDE